jgi:hypothetical protein
MPKRKYKRLPYICPVCKCLEMSEEVYQADLKEYGKVICSVCREGIMQRRDNDDTRDK